MALGAAAPTILPNGKRALVEFDVLDIARRISEGDELWRGDPTMSLYWSEPLQRFEVWGRDARGQEYLAASNERCNHELLQKLTAGDWQRGVQNAFDRVNAHNDAVRDKADRDAGDAMVAAAERMQWALRRDVGHLYNGGTHSLFSMHISRKG